MFPATNSYLTKRIKILRSKALCALLLISVTFNEISFASQINYFKLSTPSNFSSLKTSEFRESAQIHVGIRLALKQLAGFNLNSLKALGSRGFAERSVFSQKVAGSIYFDEAEECVIQDKSSNTEYSGYLIKAKIGDSSYYCLISKEKRGGSYHITIVPDRIFKEALRNGAVKLTHELIYDKDRAILDAYIEHEISPDNNAAIDEWISESLINGKYAVDDITAVQNPLYKNAGRTYEIKNYGYLLAGISRYMQALGVGQANIQSIMDAMKSTPLVLIPYTNEESLPAIKIDGKPIKVTAHSSQYATYIFVPQALYMRAEGRRLWPSDLRSYIENKLVHEIGSRCGQRVKLKDNEVLNILDEYFTRYLKAERLNILKVSKVVAREIENLQPVNLLELETRNDYASGGLEAKKGIFNRAISLAVMAIMSTTGISSCSAKTVQNQVVQNLPIQQTSQTQNEQKISKDYQFAQKYSIQQIMQDPAQAEAFIREYLRREGEYYQIARVKGIAVDGWNLDSETLKPSKIREHTAASKECLDLAVQVKVLTGNKYAVQLAGNGDAALAKKRAIQILREKISSYEQYNRDFPGFGGFLPWIKITSRVEPTSDWSDRVPALDNGEWVWSLYSAYHTLQKIGEDELAQRYKKYFGMLAKNAPIVFYDYGLHKIRAETKILNTQGRSIERGNYSNNVSGYYLDDPYEGLMMAYFMTLFTNLSQVEKERIWKDIKMEKVTTSWGTTYKGWPPQSPLDGSPHIKWAFMFLPFTDNPTAMKVYGLQEKIRTNLHKYGIPVSTNTPGAIGYTQYDPNVFGIYGPFSMIYYFALNGDVTQKNYGLAWLLNILKVDKIQGPLGSGESFSITPGTNELDEISFLLTADGKMTLWLAMMGGNINEIRESLKADGLYGKFMQHVDEEYVETFGDISQVKDNAQFRLPQEIKGKYAPKKHQATNEVVDLRSFWQYPSLDKWGDKATGVLLPGDKVFIEYKPGVSGGWGWGGGSLKGALTPTESSALYFKGEGKFKLKLEGLPGTGVFTIPVTLKGENTWTKVPLKDAAGRTFFVMVIDEIWGNITISDRFYTPDGNSPNNSAPVKLQSSERPVRPEATKVKPQPARVARAIFDLLTNYNLSASQNWGKAIVSKSGKTLIVQHNKSVDGYGWSWAGENLRQPRKLAKNEGIKIKGKGVFTLKLEGSSVVSRAVNLDKTGVVVINDLPEGLVIERIVIDKVVYGTSVTIEELEVVETDTVSSTSERVVAAIMPSAYEMVVDTREAADRIINTLWDAAFGNISPREAKEKLAMLAPKVADTKEGREKIYTAWLSQALGTMFAITRKTGKIYGKPDDQDIRAVAAKIKELGIEVFIPKDQLPGNATVQFRRALENVFGDRLRAYQDIEDLPEMMSNPQKSIVMTVGLTSGQIDKLENTKMAFAQARFMNFEKMDISKMTQGELENYLAEILGILLAARSITPEEANDAGSSSYRTLAHLLEPRMPDIKQMDTYIRTIADNSINPVDKLRYLLKAILKAIPITAYKVMKPAVEVLWSA